MTRSNPIPKTIASIIMAAGRGSRMKGYPGNKTLLPLIPGKSICQGHQPILYNIIDNLPEGPKSIIVNHCKDDIINMTMGLDLTYCFQPELNGTGGALLVAERFITTRITPDLIITMGDVPFVRKETYQGLVNCLETCDMAVLGFEPEDKKQYGVLEIQGDQVYRITEWEYWKDYPSERQAALTVCNSGIYAAKKRCFGPISTCTGIQTPNRAQRNQWSNDRHRRVLHHRSYRVHGG